MADVTTDDAALVAEVLARVGPPAGPVLVAGDGASALVEALRGRGLDAAEGAWPPRPDAGPVGARVLREPVGPSAAAVAAELAGAAAGDAADVPLVLVAGWRTPLDLASAALDGRPGPTWCSADLEGALAQAGLAVVAAAEVPARRSAPAVPAPAGDSWAATLVEAGAGPGHLGLRAVALRPAATGVAGASPFLSVVLRTQGRRPGQLREALLCLGSQVDDDLEVLVVRHRRAPGLDAAADAADEAAGRAVAAVLDDLAPALARRTRHLVATGGRRGRPLNVGLAEARGRYVAFLDDDDLVTADWSEAFRAAAERRPGAIARSRTARQDVRALPGPVGYEPVAPFTVPYRAAFDYGDHLIANQSPICSIALPRAALDRLGLRVDESLDALEDWDLLLRAAPWCGVEDSGLVTSVYHWWVDGGGSADVEGEPAWLDARRRILGRLSRRALVAGPQVASDLVALAGACEEARQRAFHAEAAQAVAEARAAAFERSRWWRGTLPLQRAARLARRARAAARR